jgi:hypothetical protein
MSKINSISHLGHTRASASDHHLSNERPANQEIHKFGMISFNSKKLTSFQRLHFFCVHFTRFGINSHTNSCWKKKFWEESIAHFPLISQGPHGNRWFQRASSWPRKPIYLAVVSQIYGGFTSCWGVGYTSSRTDSKVLR